MAIAEKMGDRRLQEELTVMLGHVFYLQGELIPSLNESERGLKSARERGDVQTQQVPVGVAPLRRLCDAVVRDRWRC